MNRGEKCKTNLLRKATYRFFCPLSLLIVLVVLGLTSTIPVVADDTGWKVPGAADGTDFTNPMNIAVSDTLYTTATGNQSQLYMNFGLNIPIQAIISGIEVANFSTNTSRGASGRMGREQRA